jgi:hypothetical protein
MADVKISGLPASTVPLAGTEVLPIVQSSTTKKVSIANVTAGRAVSALSFAPTGSALPVNGLFLPDTNAVGIATNSEERTRFFASGGVSIGNTVDPGATNLAVAGVIKTATWNGVTIGTAYGGTGLSGATPFTTNGVVYASSTSALATGSGILFDGNTLGVGKTPNTWISGYKPLQLGNGASILGRSDDPGLEIGNNEYRDAAGNRIYLATQPAAMYHMYSGVHSWLTAPSGTAGTTATFTQAMTLTNNGSLCVGAAATVNSSILTFQNGAAGANNATSVTGITGTSYHLIFSSPNGNVGTISTDGSLTSYTVTSDRRLKENIIPLTTGLSTVLALKPSQYNYIADPTTQIQGFIADELQPIVSHAVTGQPNAVDSEGNPVYQSVDSSFLIPHLVAAIQELNIKFEAYIASHP